MSQDAKTNAALAWLFAPITSFIWRDETDAFLRNHARESLYVGIFNAITVTIVFFLNFCVALTLGFIEPVFFLAQCILTLVWLAVWASILVPRIIGIVKAMNGETWEVPYISEFMRRYIKL